MHPLGVEGEGCYGWVGEVYGWYFSAGVVRVCGVWVGGRDGVVVERGCCVPCALL